MKKFLALLLALVMALSLVACGKKDDDSKKDDNSTNDMAGSVAMVLPGLVTDKAFNQFTYEGMMKAAQEKGIKTAYKENVAQDEQVEVLRQFAQAGYEIVIGQGGQFGDAVATVAKEFPDTKFVFSVGTDTYGLPNMTAATIDYGHAGFVAGVLAAMYTKSNKVAFILGEYYETHRAMYRGIVAGLQQINPDIEVVEVLTGDWADTVKARECALSAISSGCDVLIPCLDAAGAGVAAAAQDSEGVVVVGTVADYAVDCSAPDVTAASAVFAWDALGYAEALGDICDGQAHVIGVADGGVKAVINTTLTEEQQAAYDAAINGLANGSITF